jgi:hypothetical protein
MHNGACHIMWRAAPAAQHPADPGLVAARAGTPDLKETNAMGICVSLQPMHSAEPAGEQVDIDKSWFDLTEIRKVSAPGLPLICGFDRVIRWPGARLSRGGLPARGS